MTWLKARKPVHACFGRRTRVAGGRRGFSLMEVMIGIFILGIGVIAIAALFPAGIAQQQFSNDDVMGPIVANNAMAVIRGKVSAADFGTYEEFGIPTANIPRGTIAGDWPWIRPTILLSNDGNTFADERGTIDLFGYARANGGNFMSSTVLAFSADSYDNGNNFWSIPFNSARYGNATPLIGITQAERYFPQRSEEQTALSQPQYAWDCMFRRYEGRIYVAIFVYRIADPEALANGPYRVGAAADNPDITAIPHRLTFGTGSFGSGGNFGVWAAGTNPIDGISPANNYAPLNPNSQDHAWQEPRQWMVDQNANIHRVVSNYPDNNTLQVELVRPPAITPNLPTNWFGPSGSPVSDIWYVPLVDSLGRSLTPVYVSVQEL